MTGAKWSCALRGLFRILVLGAIVAGKGGARSPPVNAPGSGGDSPGGGAALRLSNGVAGRLGLGYGHFSARDNGRGQDSSTPAKAAPWRAPACVARHQSAVDAEPGPVFLSSAFSLDSMISSNFVCHCTVSLGSGYTGKLRNVQARLGATGPLQNAAALASLLQAVLKAPVTPGQACLVTSGAFQLSSGPSASPSRSTASGLPQACFSRPDI